MSPCLVSIDITMLYATGLISTCSFFMFSKVSNALAPYSKKHGRQDTLGWKLTLPAFIKKRSFFSYSLGPYIFHCLKVIGVLRERGLNLSLVFFSSTSYAVASLLCSFQIPAHPPIYKLVTREMIVLLRANVFPKALINISNNTRCALYRIIKYSDSA